MTTHVPRRPAPGPRPLFGLGQCCITRGAAALLDAAQLSPSALLTRHVLGDWPALDAKDRADNLRSIKDGSRIQGAWLIGGERVWAITEAVWPEGCDEEITDPTHQIPGRRWKTTLLLPREY